MRYGVGTCRSALVGLLVFGASGTFGPSASAGGAHPLRISSSGVRETGRRRKGSELVKARKPMPEGASDAPEPTPKTGRHRVARVVPVEPKRPCFHDAIQFERGFGGDRSPIVLTRCDGRPAPQSVEQLSILVRPMSAPRPSFPTMPVAHLPDVRPVAKDAPREWLPGVKLVDEGLVVRLQNVVDHFRAAKVTVVSGYRPRSLGSFHQSAKALDFHIDGVTHEALVAYCRTLPDTGCGYYPNSSFIHMDVRPKGTGHVYWIDASGPGETPRYVSTWPPRHGLTTAQQEIPKPDPSAPGDEQTHPTFPSLPPWASDTKVDARTIAPLGGSEVKDDPFHP
jgi:hypothetical protein